VLIWTLSSALSRIEWKLRFQAGFYPYSFIIRYSVKSWWENNSLKNRMSSTFRQAQEQLLSTINISVSGKPIIMRMRHAITENAAV